MKQFREFIKEVYDPEVQGRSQIRKMGQGGRIGQERKKTAPEKRRMKAVGGGKMVPAKDYKDRKDIGKTRAKSATEQQPTQERGSAREKQLAAAKAERKRAAQARAAQKKGKTTVLPSQATSKSKKTPKELAKSARKMLAKKKEKVDPKYKPQKASGLTRAERQQLRRAGQRLVKDITKGRERPRSAYEPGISIALRSKS